MQGDEDDEDDQGDEEGAPSGSESLTPTSSQTASPRHEPIEASNAFAAATAETAAPGVASTPGGRGFLSRLWGWGGTRDPFVSPSEQPAASPSGTAARWRPEASDSQPDSPSSSRAAGAPSAQEWRGEEDGEQEASPLANWSVEDVCEWLGASDGSFAAYVPLFRENHIDGCALGLLTREDLADIGVRSVGHRLAILRARADLHVIKTDRPARANAPPLPLQ